VQPVLGITTAVSGVSLGAGCGGGDGVGLGGGNGEGLVPGGPVYYSGSWSGSGEWLHKQCCAEAAVVALEKCG
jgi:hypothetical protein